ncbi:hypothetical protein EV363DRAFT_1398922 [Boletus edulis]|nr:hypothetical protein EV363DRAFT_1398922 [Boletus edulis]
MLASAPSLVRPATSRHLTRKQPHITNQLDPLWSEDLQQLAKQRSERDRISEQRRQMQLASQQWFILHWYDKLVAWLGDNIVKIEVFEDQLMRWITTDLQHTFTLEPKCHLFLHRYGVTDCQHFDEELQVAKQQSRPRHLHFNMTAERQALRQKEKQKARLSTTMGPEDSDNEVEIIEDVDATPVPRVTAKQGLQYSPCHSSFRQMDDKALLACYPQEELFGLVFPGATFRKPTYYENRAKFTCTVASVLAEHEAAGNSNKGRWSSYLAARRLARGEGSKPPGRSSRSNLK